MTYKLKKIKKSFALDYYAIEILKLLVKKGFVISEDEAIYKGIFYLRDKYLDDDPDLERLEYNLMAEASLAKDWLQKSEDVWDTLLNKEKKHKKR